MARRPGRRRRLVALRPATRMHDPAGTGIYIFTGFLPASGPS